MADVRVGSLGIAEADVVPPRRRVLRIAWLIRQNPLGFIGLLIIITLFLAGTFGPGLAIKLPGGTTIVETPRLAPYTEAEFAGVPTEDPSMDHPFGTDNLGRDMLSRVIYGARISLLVGFISVLGGTAAAVVIGIVSGYLGGWVDSFIQRTNDTLIAFPQLIFLLIVVQVLGPSMRNVILVIALGIIPGVSRVVRGAVLSERNNQYVEAARALGASTPRILFRHILPNVMALAIVIMTTLLGIAILAEASLSFLGLGIPVPNPSWGTDVSAARNHFPIAVWWAFFPGLAITLTVLGFNLLGDSLRDIADPRLRGGR